MSRRLSHWDNTSSCTFWGRWVEVSRYSPNLRPSAAISAAYLVASDVTLSDGWPGQTLCASSMTIRHGSRRARLRHSVESTVSEISRCSSWLSSEPRSTTRQREVGSSEFVHERTALPAAPDRPVRERPRLAARTPSWWMSGLSDDTSASRPLIIGRPFSLAARMPDSAAYSSRSSDRVEAEHRSLRRRIDVDELQTGAGVQHRDRSARQPPRGPPSHSRLRPRERRRLGPPPGGRSPSWDRG